MVWQLNKGHWSSLNKCFILNICDRGMVRFKRGAVDSCVHVRGFVFTRFYLSLVSFDPDFIIMSRFCGQR